MGVPGTRASRAVLLVTLALGVVAFGGCGGDDDGDGLRSFPEARASKGSKMDVELAVTAGAARWEPSDAGGHGKLILDDVDPRMALLAAAPHKGAATLPASVLRAHWEALFGKHESAANAVLSVEPKGGEREMVAFKVKLDDAHLTGRRFAFDAEALDDTGVRSHSLGRKDRSLGAATLLIDPEINDSIKDMWAKLVAFFAGERLSVPKAPIYPGEQRGIVFDNGADVTGGPKVYAGPIGEQQVTSGNWSELQGRIADGAGGSWRNTKARDKFSPEFTGSKYEGLALFGGVAGLGFGNIDFAPADGKVRVTKSAIYSAKADELNIGNAEFGGVNMRGLDANLLNVSNSVLDTVDLTGSVFGSESARSLVENSAFVNVRSRVSADDPSGKPDPATGKPLGFDSVDFVSTTLQDSSLQGARFSESTFQGCGFTNVDFSIADFQGRSPADNGQRFEPTFDNSVFDTVSFEGATLENVSFRGVDFSKVSLDGATLKMVDFTGARGLANVDLSKVTIDGRVYGLGPERFGLPPDVNRDLVRSLTFDGAVPAIDAQSGWDRDPSGNIIEPDTGVRLRRFHGKLRPVDPHTGRVLTDPNNPQQELEWEAPARGSGQSGIYDPARRGSDFPIDYFTGEFK